jgi:hypothetical protein
MGNHSSFSGILEDILEQDTIGRLRHSLSFDLAINNNQEHLTVLLDVFLCVEEFRGCLKNFRSNRPGS